MIEGTTNDVYPSKYLKASDIKTETKVTIKDIKKEEIGDKEKLIVEFDEIDKGLVCNKTNCNRIEKIVGSETFSDWPGRSIVLYVVHVPFKGEDVPAIRVKAPIVAPVAPA